MRFVSSKTFKNDPQDCYQTILCNFSGRIEEQDSRKAPWLKCWFCVVLVLFWGAEAWLMWRYFFLRKQTADKNHKGMRKKIYGPWCNTNQLCIWGCLRMMQIVSQGFPSPKVRHWFWMVMRSPQICACWNFPTSVYWFGAWRKDINNCMSMLFVRKHINMMFSMWVRYL